MAKKTLPKQQQNIPGIESQMTPRPKADDPSEKGCGCLDGKVAIITGGDSGIGRAVAVDFAKEGCDVVIVYNKTDEDAEETRKMVGKYGKRCLASKKIRVNGVAPGPIWPPLIPSTFDEEKVPEFGGNVPMAKPGQPEEVASCYVFLASNDASYMTGQIPHPNGGIVVNG